MTAPRVTFMDCDGVIFDVNAAKLRAFGSAVDDYPEEARDELVARHAQGGGVSRYDRFRWFFTEVCPVDDVDAAVKRAVQRFGEITRRAYDDLTPHPEALRFAEAMGGPQSVYVVSGSDQTELRAIFEEHGITSRFAAILGSPRRKADHFREVLGRRHIAPEDALMLGDGSGDWHAAREVGIPFVLLREMSTWTEWRGELDASARVMDTWVELNAGMLGGTAQDIAAPGADGQT